MDPMCGGGSIPLEGIFFANSYSLIEFIHGTIGTSHLGALGYQQGFHLGGDIHEKAFSRAGDNLAALREERQGRCFQVIRQFSENYSVVRTLH